MPKKLFRSGNKRQHSYPHQKPIWALLNVRTPSGISEVFMRWSCFFCCAHIFINFCLMPFFRESRWSRRNSYRLDKGRNLGRYGLLYGIRQSSLQPAWANSGLTCPVKIEEKIQRSSTLKVNKKRKKSKCPARRRLHIWLKSPGPTTSIRYSSFDYYCDIFDIILSIGWELTSA